METKGEIMELREKINTLYAVKAKLVVVEMQLSSEMATHRIKQSIELGTTLMAIA